MKRWMIGFVAAVPAVLALPVVASAKVGKADAAVHRGEYLVTVGGCNDCHSPKKMGPNGPVPDLTRTLSGHPQQDAITSAPKVGAGPWGYAVSPDLTAWAGPWGVSFAANLTPDPDTGLGKWSAENFIEAMRTGRHMGRGRPILPPMPYYNYAKMTDPDLRPYSRTCERSGRSRTGSRILSRRKLLPVRDRRQARRPAGREHPPSRQLEPVELGTVGIGS